MSDLSGIPPWRSPLGWNNPTVVSTEPLCIQVSIPNEDPDTEDDLTIQATFTQEGIILDLLVSSGESVATFGQMYDEFVDTLYDLDPMGVPPRPYVPERGD